MTRLLTISRAARLIGIPRGALQGKIKNGELATFEGMVAVDELLRAYPETQLEDNAALERIENIKDSAFGRRMRERVLPGADVLLARMAGMSAELAQTRARLDYYRMLVEQLKARLREPEGPAAAPAAMAGLLAWLEHSLAPELEGEEAQTLLARERLMRIMTAQVRIQPSGHDFLVDGNDTLLEAALRAGLALDYGCSAGSCGQCKARVLSGEVHRTRHYDFVLTDAEKQAGVVLMCCNTAVGDLVIEAREAHGAADMPLQSIESRVKAVSPLAADMRLVHLQTPRSQRLRFLAGQSVTLTLPGGSAAELPVASCPCDDRNLHFHVRRRPGDGFSEHVFAGLKAADAVRVEGPRGSFVLDEDSPRPLIFIAGDGGFAPIKSLLEHAMALETAESLHLYRLTPGGSAPYLDNLCRSWSDALDNFHYTALAPESLEKALQAHPRLGGHDVYLSASAPLASTAEYQLLDRGLPRAQLFVDQSAR